MKTYWYKETVFYQIYPRSFCDSDGDGIGDIRGIISKLDYLKDLGIGAVWLSPVYKSPNDDNGYDISDYRDIMDEFGTFADWKEMSDGLHSRGIRLVMDLVVNHTSDEHPWFEESKKSKDNPYRNYYIWRDGTGADKKSPPNGWRACFGGSAWEYDETTGQFFLHLFSKKQPDLNWDNPNVRREVADICNFWLDLGVDGFRCDVITYIAKNFKEDGYKSDNYTIAQNWQEYIRELRSRSWDNYDTMIVGECCGADAKNADTIHGDGTGLLDTVISFDHLPWFRRYSLVAWKGKMSAWQRLSDKCWWSLYFENHDQQRAVSRFIRPGYEKDGAKMLGTVLMFLRGTPYIYQGQELGMTNIPLSAEEFKDIQSVNMLRDAGSAIAKRKAYKHLLLRARDHARTPVQWNGGKNAGFSDGEPWMKVNPNYISVNAEAEIKDAGSVLNYYKRLIAARKSVSGFVKDGKYREHFSKNKRYYCFTRETKDGSLLVVASFSHRPAKFTPPSEFDLVEGKLLISNNEDADKALAPFVLKPYEVRVYQI
ncbi:MAG: alpha-glucosidase [Clostridiaceae bacterium]|jgi:oligo-1,6-glucosidase|nr:alpha-glucosidase [Clostridiaceae bacterium]